MLGQGGTEYLVLLAVALVIALIVMSLIFSNENDDALITQSEIYWKSASPIAIEEIIAAGDPNATGTGTPTDETKVYMKIRNNGANPIRLSKIIGNDGQTITVYDNHECAFYPPTGCPENLTNIYIPGGGTECFGADSPSQTFNICKKHHLVFLRTTSIFGWVLKASRMCNVPTGGRFEMKTFGFEYIEYVDNIPITKVQVGTVPLRAKCGALLGYS